MAAKKRKKPAAKKAVKKAVTKKKATTRQAPKRTATKKTARAVKKPARKGTPRTPPMHAQTSHPELSEASTPRDETFEIFKAYDRDGSGSIDAGELARLLEALGQPLTELDLAIALDAVDVNRSGKISWPEFQAWWSSR